MLGKLIRHEWKETSKMGCLLLFVVVLITLFGWLAFRTPMWKSISNGNASFSWLDIFSVLTLMMYVMMLAGINYGITIYLGVRFYQTMYTDQGYLTHTLPVTKHQLLLSKILVSGLWIFFLMLSLYLSVFILGASMLSLFLPQGYSLASLWRELGLNFGELLELIGEEMDFNVIRWLVTLVVTTILSPFATVTILFGAISMGQLFSKHRVLAAILSYIGIMVAVSVLSSVFRSILMFSRITSAGSYLNNSLDSSIIINLLLAVGLYFVSWHVTSNRLNMQ
ncbi:hypothetical protein NSB25_03420 [Acetatifactor muris]|uniref:ABC-2 family transporter protein n=1 Tax=Acetatifactor muris TaxID=879566 RepID=A0A2K4ZCB4_9FIRM|nr:hypothetical protein [Acetatifactor muris]MCR2046327.1 hypothetical protein [Acetatifactor muris]SOY28105.1 hypothetical protein AMURIS_00813 [Acetatifactor muris]